MLYYYLTTWVESTFTESTATWTESTTGVKETNAAAVTSVFSVFPNPSVQQFNCIIANQLGKTLRVIITDALGKSVYEEQWNINKALYKSQINTSNLSGGSYFVTIKGDNILETKKILIQK